MKVEDDVPLLKLDFVLIEQALTNLIHNAVLYTPKGTEVTIKSYLEENKCAISVVDNGPGLPEEDTEKVFEKFYRAANGRPGGTGLGLTIARGFVEAHHGKITVRNRPEGGAEFIIYLPMDAESRGKSERILNEEKSA